uniref:Ig-like domain-containing protein n=1 Tax=Oreochromis aureus TaxID=47969 RepID=A0A668T7Y1_OREAU
PPGFIEGNDVVSPDEPTMAGHTSVNINGEQMESNIIILFLHTSLTFSPFFMMSAIKPFCFSFTESVSNILITSSKTDLVEFNSSVTLVCSASGSPTSFLWFNGSSEVTANDRVHFTDGGSNLTIINVTRFDQGPFRCLVSNLLSNGTSDPLTLKITLPALYICGKESKPSSTVLMCSVSKGTSSSYQWFNGSSMITANEHLQLSSGNSILTIRNVTRYDQGPYKCNVSNNVSNDISAPVNLNINYGPSNAKMTVMPVSSIYKGGSNITLSCSADSSPPAMITWMIDGVYQTNTSSIELQDATESDSGNYTCLIQNTVTLRFSSKTTAIQIVGKFGLVHSKKEIGWFLHLQKSNLQYVQNNFMFI